MEVRGTDVKFFSFNLDPCDTLSLCLLNSPYLLKKNHQKKLQTSTFCPLPGQVIEQQFCAAEIVLLQRSIQWYSVCFSMCACYLHLLATWTLGSMLQLGPTMVHTHTPTHKYEDTGTQEVTSCNTGPNTGSVTAAPGHEGHISRV